MSLKGLRNKLYERGVRLLPPRVAAVRLLPPRVAARIDLIRPSFRASWGGALNGQLMRQAMVRQLVCTLKFQVVVETGTFRGTSTEFFSHLTGAPVFTVEASPRFFHYSRARFERSPQIHVALDDSRRFLQRLVSDPAVPKQDALFYLDAHWQEDLPLREELTIIAANWTRCVIVIDDFEVPGDPGYSFDDYGHGKRLTADYLPAEDLSGFLLLYPSTASREETGDQRGCCVLTSKDLEDQMASLSYLRCVGPASSGTS